MGWQFRCIERRNFSRLRQSLRPASPAEERGRQKSETAQPTPPGSSPVRSASRKPPAFVLWPATADRDAETRPGGRHAEGRLARRENFPHDRSGHFIRPDAPFRNWVTADGAPGPTGTGGFKAEPGRYHLIVSLACPWAHRTLIFRKLKGLEGMISLSVVHWLLGERGWTFVQGRASFPTRSSARASSTNSTSRRGPTYSGRITVPVLWDRAGTIVSNESSEIIRMSTALSTAGRRPRATIIRRNSAPRSTRSTRVIYPTSTTGSTRRLRHHPGGL